jgi:hypothetical protein
MMRRQVAFRAAEGHRLLQPHHDRVGKSAQQHHQRENDVHDADLLVVDARQPVAPERPPEAVIGDEPDQRDAAERDGEKGHDEDRLVIRDRVEGKPAEDELQEIWIGEHGKPVQSLAQRAVFNG